MIARRSCSVAEELPPDEHGRYARQQRIPGWQQHRIADASLLVVGAGAIGNEVLKNLALLGVGHLVIVDMDRIERSNLSRTVLFHDHDVGQSKAATAARAVQRLNPAVRVTVLEGDLRFALGLGYVRHSTLVLGCLDNQGARSWLSRMCLAANVPLLDAGMWAWGGEIRAFLSPDDACFDCLLSPEARDDQWRRFSCTSGFRPVEATPHLPTTITTTAIIGGLLAQEAVRVLLDQPMERGTALVYNGLDHQLYRTHLARDPACPHHTPLDWTTVTPLPGTAATVTPHALLTAAQERWHLPVTLDLGREVLLSFDCPTCATTDLVLQPLALLPATAAHCPRCGDPRLPRTISTITLDDAYAHRPLAHFGIPDGDVVRLWVGEQVCLFELARSADH